MTGFKSETESGVKSAFVGLGKVVAGAFTGIAAFDILKSSVESAAEAQKSAEVIRREFGAAGQELLRFSNTTGTALGASNTATDQASAKFGILFRNMGIGQQVAAEMARNWERLGLAFNEATGGGAQGAVRVLGTLQTAASGVSTRGLRSLGISVNAASEQVAAFKLGLIQSVTQALTPAQKATAIYALAMAHLPKLLSEAKAHTGDLSNVQARLSAEWSKAEGELGAALLPQITKVAKAFADWLDKMTKSGRLQRDFNQAARIASGLLHTLVGAVKLAVGAWNLLSGAVGGAKGVAVAFFTVMAISKIRAVASAITTDLVANGFRQLQVATAAEQAAYIEAFGTMEVATIGLSTTIQAALISTGIGALIVAVGVLAALIVTHFSKVKKWLGDFAHWIWSHWWVVSFLPIVGQMVWVIGEIIKHWDAVKTFFLAIAHFFRDVWTHPIRAIEELFSGLWKAIELGLGTVINFFIDRINGIILAVDDAVGWLGVHVNTIGHIAAQTGINYGHKFNKSATDVIKGPGGVGDAIAAAGGDAAKAITSTVTQMAGDAATAAAKQSIEKMRTALQATIDAAHKAIESSIMSAKNNLDKIGQDLAKTIDQIQAKIGGAAGAIAGSPQGQAFAKLKKLIESGAPSFEIQRATEALSSQLKNVGKTQQTLISRQLGNLTAAFDKGSIGYKAFESRLHKILHDNGITLREALKAGGPAFADAFKAQVAALGEQAHQIALLPAKYRGIGGAGGAADIRIIRPLQVIRDENVKIANAAAKQRAAQLKATEKQTTLLRLINSTLVADLPTPGHGKQPKGRGSHNARRGAAIGSHG